MKSLCRKIACIFIVVFSLLQLMHTFGEDLEIQIRNQLLCKVRTSFPKAWERSASLYGIFPWPHVSLQAVQSPSRKKTVLLISGLDDPGFAFQELAPTLLQQGFSVYIFSYPNDQSIEASTNLLYKNLASSSIKGPLSLVCHSMGGLVARNLLTRPDIDYSGKTKKNILPRIDNLILVGTPNKGSQLARFRILLEVKDQFYQFFQGRYKKDQKNLSLLHFLMDGTGAAGVEILPNSSFLKRLNQRNLPEDIAPWIIAGRVLPWDNYLCRRFGDGLVSPDSAKGIKTPAVEVPGSHLGMLRNLKPGTDRVPCGIPAILSLLMGNDGH